MKTIGTREKLKFEKFCEGIWRFIIFMKVRFEKYYESFDNTLFSFNVKQAHLITNITFGHV